ncbi:MAG: hypothetical protein FWG10_11075 [Eubacteriaceae bacterium]|nr:hypothetical protein [Eubacteriaceae bacterium]
MLPIIAAAELESGYYYVEGSSMLYDELCPCLDGDDIENIFLVAQYYCALEKEESANSAIQALMSKER